MRQVIRALMNILIARVILNARGAILDRDREQERQAHWAHLVNRKSRSGSHGSGGTSGGSGDTAVGSGGADSTKLINLNEGKSLRVDASESFLSPINESGSTDGVQSLLPEMFEMPQIRTQEEETSAVYSDQWVYPESEIGTFASMRVSGGDAVAV